MRSLLALGCMLCVLNWASLRAAAQPDVQELEEQAMKAAVAKIAPSVVRIETFGGLQKVGQVLVGTGPTTGLAVSEDGFVLSSAFNFIQQPTSILVTLPSGKRVTANIVARDHSRMLVLLKINSEEPLTVPEAVERDEMIVGQWAIAVGRTFVQDQVNMSAGIVSATSRIWGKAIQTDAKVSPSNYGGPMIDIHGRVLGVLVPLSPQGGSEVAGAEWYDSGIGFAVPLADINRHLEKMKRGEDLYPGLLGVALKRGDIYSLPAEIAACPANSPAAKAGLKAGDTIVEVDGAKIVRQAQLRHALGSKYAGDTVAVVVLRGDERIEANIELTDKVDPYEHPFLGMLPLRETGTAKAGVAVRFVYPGSPAEQAGLEVGDRVLSLAGKEIPNASSMQDMVAAHEPGAKVTLQIQRGGEMRELQITLATLPTDVPQALPPARAGDPPPAESRPAVGIVDVNIPEENNKCIAYVPDDYHPDVAHGLLVWLHAPGGFDQEALVARWKDHCEKHDMILLAPMSADPAKWLPTETAFVRKTIDDVIGNYNIDRTRIVAHGFEGGGALAYMLAFGQRELIRGLAPVDAAPPARTQPPDNDPVYRLAVYTTKAAESTLARQIEAAIKQLQDMKYPVTVKDVGPQPRYLEGEEIDELVRWIDTLDRI